MRHKYCVLGNGLLGAAMALHIARQAEPVCVVGASYGAGRRIYSSHEDRTRIIRLWHSDPYWTELAAGNAVLAAELEAEGGGWRRPAPVLYKGLDASAAASPCVRPAREGGRPGFAHRDRQGGILDPKAYIAAMNGAAARRGAVVRPARATRVRRSGARYLVSTDQGEIEAERLVDARGLHGPGARAPGARVQAKVLVYVERPLEGPEPRPSCLIDLEPRADALEEVYAVTDYAADAGVGVSKFGAAERRPIFLRGQDAIARWYAGGYAGYPYEGQLREQALRLLPEGARVVATRPCAFVRTEDRRPVIRAEASRLTLGGCNGMAAKCCQALAAAAWGRWQGEAAA